MSAQLWTDVVLVSRTLTVQVVVIGVGRAGQRDHALAEDQHHPQTVPLNVVLDLDREGALKDRSRAFEPSASDCMHTSACMHADRDEHCTKKNT